METLATQANQATQVSRVKEAEGVQLVLQVHLARLGYQVFLDQKENKDHAELRVMLGLVVFLKERKVTWEREVSRAI